MPDLLKEIVKLPPNDPGGSPVHVGVVYPNSYPVAISSLGYQTVHRIVHSYPGVVAHRIVNEPDFIHFHNRTLEEALEIQTLDALFISCSFELDYFNILRILNRSQIPLERRRRGKLPLVIAGGIAVTGNPEPLAAFADAISIGDAEEILPGLLDDFIDHYPLLRGPKFKKARMALYEDWSQRPGVYVPEMFENKKGEFRNPKNRSITQVCVSDPDSYPSYTPIVTPEGVYGAKNLISISDGCDTRCRFCMLGYIRPAGIPRSAESILKNARRFSPHEASVGLISSRVSEHPDIVKIINELSDEGYEVSVSSLKVSSTTPELLEALYRAGAMSVTFAPEHGSDQMREIIGKPYTYEEVRDRVKWAYDAGLNRVKLYFLTGFEEETDEDLQATTDFVISLIGDIGLAKLPSKCRMEISIAPFVPKACTPFQRRPMDSVKTLRRKLRQITSPLKGIPRMVVDTESPRDAIAQGILSIADRSIAFYLETAVLHGIPINKLPSWEEAYDHGLNPSGLVLKSRPSNEWELPWKFIRRPGLGNIDD